MGVPLAYVTAHYEGQPSSPQGAGTPGLGRVIVEATTTPLGSAEPKLKNTDKELLQLSHLSKDCPVIESFRH